MSILITRRSLLMLFTQVSRSKPKMPSNINSITTFTQKLPQPKVLVSYRTNLEIHRNKSKSSKKKQAAAESDEDESEDESPEDFDSLVVDKSTKIMNIKVNSLRADVILKSGLSIARNKIEEMFYQSKIRVNGKKISKKSDTVQEGDELDIIKGISDNNPKFLNVGRVEIISALLKKDSYTVRIRRCKNLVVENYDEAWKPDDQQ